MQRVSSFKLWILAFVPLFLSVATFAQTGGNSNTPVDISVQFVDKSDNPDFILYNVNKQLAIADFKGKPDMSSVGVGATFSGIQVSMEGQSGNGKMEVKVLMLVYFDKSQSWMKPEGQDERVLKHEQIHFDLTAIYACKMYQAILKEKFNSKNVKQRIHEIHDKLIDELQARQALYDKQTQHGTIAEQQKTWAENITKEKAAMGCL
jgi:hypothetical protein